MKHIENKLQEFIDKTLVADISVLHHQLDSNKIRYQDPKHLKGISAVVDICVAMSLSVDTAE